MTQFRQTIIIVFIFFLTSCSRTSETKKDGSESKDVLSINSLPDLDSLDAKIIQAIKPLFPDIDTLVLDDSPPLYCGLATEQEKANDYFPIAAHPSDFSALSKILGKTILFKSKIYGFDPKIHDSWDSYLSDVVQLDITGTIYSKTKIHISESYIHDFNYCIIEKWFTYSNGQWTCDAKEKQCWTPGQKTTP